MSSIFLLWDESHIWGLLAWRALAHFGLPLRVVGAAQVAGGLLAAEPPSVLVVPGGTARRKYERLGEAGVAAVRDYVAGGGAYLGFCGGAGLGLTGPHGLGLCPWRRRAFTDRLQHFVSGHMRVTQSRDAGAAGLAPAGLPAQPLLPVWWPARFEPGDDPGVRVLAAYAAPGPDFWVADLPLAAIPRGPLEDLETQYGLAIWPHSMAGQPCMVEGAFGHGRYLLSYSHLETPASAEANLWLAHILAVLGGVAPAASGPVPAWDLESLPLAWPAGPGGAALFKARTVLGGLVRQGMDNLLLFSRTPWLLGWRRGIPGAALNSLLAMLAQAQALRPNAAAAGFWEARHAAFSEALDLFAHALSGYLLAERLAMTLGDSEAGLNQDLLRAQRTALFGPPMAPGGLFGPLLADVDELLARMLEG
ncbi:MAG: BPL-N domain-containing protein [Thermodesulfobacteriota bacterium]